MSGAKRQGTSAEQTEPTARAGRKRVVVRKRLSPKRAAEVRELAASLGRSGTLAPSMTVEDGLTSLPHFFLGYEEGRPAAYAEWFYDGTRSVELLLFVHPAYRRRGWMKTLLAELRGTLAAVPELSAARLLVVCEPEDKTLRAALRHMGAVKLRSDYVLELHPEEPPFSETLGEASPQSLPEGVTPVWQRQGNVTELTLYREGTEIAHARLFLEERQAFLFDVWVAPAHRRQGLGRCLVTALRTRREGRPMLLHVDSGKRAALALYRSVGCEVREQRDFFGRIGEK